MSQSFVPYTDAVEVVEPGEGETFAALAATMREIAQKLGDRQRRTTRPVHGKSHGLLRAEVAVRDGLPEPLRQGLAATPARLTPARWSGSAWAFVRGGGASSLAGGGQLGGSQAGVRIVYRLDRAGRLALAARAYLPTDHPRGGEAAAGIDLRPLPNIPFRLSVERRVALGRDGRDAWSAYAAGGFFRGLPGSLELDGYGQAGIVGMRRRDLFADGAVRLARRVPLAGGVDLLAGAGVWAAAQPGAARLDVGPHVALRIPLFGASVAVAADWRVRVAGDARPGSGAALTVATDF